MEEVVYISLGWNCDPAIMRKNKYGQMKSNGYMTCPFDLCVTPYHGLCACLRDNFTNFFNLHLSDGGQPHGDRVMNKYDMWFNHEIPLEEYTSNEYEKFKHLYQARINNFNNYINSGKRIVFLHSHPFENSQELIDILDERYPQLDYSIIAIRSVNVGVYKTHYPTHSHTIKPKIQNDKITYV